MKKKNIKTTLEVIVAFFVLLKLSNIFTGVLTTNIVSQLIKILVRM